MTTSLVFWSYETKISWASVVLCKLTETNKTFYSFVKVCFSLVLFQTARFLKVSWWSFSFVCLDSFHMTRNKKCIWICRKNKKNLKIYDFQQTLTAFTIRNNIISFMNKKTLIDWIKCFNEKCILPERNRDHLVHIRHSSFRRIIHFNDHCWTVIIRSLFRKGRSSVNVTANIEW